MNLLNIPIGKNYPDIINCIVEIPKGSRAKYEYMPEFEVFRLNKFWKTSMLYPINYGFVPQTLAQDGDALDVLIYSEEPIMTGTLVKCHVKGVLNVVDRGEPDHKIFAIPTFYEGTITFPKKTVENFFENYKKLEASNDVVVKGWDDIMTASNIIKSAHDRFNEQNSLKH